MEFDSEIHATQQTKLWCFECNSQTTNRIELKSVAYESMLKRISIKIWKNQNEVQTREIWPSKVWQSVQDVAKTLVKNSLHSSDHNGHNTMSLELILLALDSYLEPRHVNLSLRLVKNFPSFPYFEKNQVFNWKLEFWAYRELLMF